MTNGVAAVVAYVLCAVGDSQSRVSRAVISRALSYLSL